MLTLEGAAMYDIWHYSPMNGDTFPEHTCICLLLLAMPGEENVSLFIA